MEYIRKIVCAVAFLDMILSTLAIPTYLADAFLFARSGITLEMFPRVFPFCILLLAKTVVSYCTLKYSCNVISATFRSCECHTLEKKVRRANHWRNGNIANLVLILLAVILKLIYFALDYPLPLHYALDGVGHQILDLVPLILPSVLITAFGFLHAYLVYRELKENKEVENEIESKTTQTSSQNAFVQPEFSYKNWTGLFAFLEIGTSGAQLIMFIHANVSILGGYISLLEYEYNAMLMGRTFKESSLSSSVQIMWYILAASWYFLKPLVSLFLSIKTITVIVHVCPLISLTTMLRRTSLFRNWNCLLLLINVIMLIVSVTLSSSYENFLNYSELVWVVSELVMRLGFTYKLWLFVSEIKAHMKNSQK